MPLLTASFAGSIGGPAHIIFPATIKVGEIKPILGVEETPETGAGDDVLTSDMRAPKRSAQPGEYRRPGGEACCPPGATGWRDRLSKMRIQSGPAGPSLNGKTNISKRPDFGKEYRRSFLQIRMAGKFWLFIR
jgi:hypothetical protein